MDIKIFKDYTALSYHAARLIVQQIQKKPTSVICLAAGDSPLLCYSFTVNMLELEKVNVSHCIFVGLDEWVGIAPENKGSCHFYLSNYFVTPLKLEGHQFKMFDSMTNDLLGECHAMDQFINSVGGIDLIVVGIGINGHIGFNEPGISPELYSHVAELDDKTRQVGQKYFASATQLTKGITLGLRHFIEARKAILVASGPTKAHIMPLALEHKVSESVPASIIQKHVEATVIMDEAAAGQMKLK